MEYISYLDYLSIFGTLFISTFIGLYSGYRGRRQSSEQYFLGNKQMSVGAVAGSLSMTVMSAVTYIGTPAEVYTYGPYFVLMSVTKVLVAAICTAIFLPVFYKMQVVSIYEYLDKRFNKTLRYCVIVFDLLHFLLFGGVAIYAPALMLSTVTGIGNAVSILIIGGVCTIYTTIGGFKGVIWTDVFQGLVLSLSFLTMIIGGSMKSGGPARGMQVLHEGQRSKLVNFDPDIRVVYSFWSIMIGGTTFFTSLFACKQIGIQRYNSCKTLFQARVAAVFGILGCGLIEVAAVITGVVIYIYYAGCDPKSAGLISSNDEIVPFFILSGFGSHPGVVGFLVAGAFAAALSSISSLINSCAAILGEDFVKPLKKNMPDAQYVIVAKGLSLVVGGIFIMNAFFASVLGNVVKAVLSLGGMFAGPILGVYTLGVLLPRANSKGSTIGLFVGVGIGVFTKTASDSFNVVREKPPVFTYDCPVDPLNLTEYSTQYFTANPDYRTYSSMEEQRESAGYVYFGMSYLYYSTLTSSTTILIGYLFSLIFRYWDKKYSELYLFNDIIQKYPKSLLPREIHCRLEEKAQRKNVEFAALGRESNTQC